MNTPIPVTATDLRDELGTYLVRVEENERFVVMKHGKPVAVVISMYDYALLQHTEAVLGAESIRVIVNEEIDNRFAKGLQEITVITDADAAPAGDESED